MATGHSLLVVVGGKCEFAALQRGFSETAKADLRRHEREGLILRQFFQDPASSAHAKVPQVVQEGGHSQCILQVFGFWHTTCCQLME